MHITKYQTRTDHFLISEPLTPINGKMGGALTLSFAEKPLAAAFAGFGVALTGSSCDRLSTMQPNARKAFLQDIYGANGLGLSVGRLTVGASDYSKELYSYDDVPYDTTLAHFSIARDEEYILPMIREVLQIRPDLRLFASPWSPPAWMKTGGSFCGGYMRAEYLDVYADYIVKFVQAYRAAGVHIKALTPQNEPETQQSGKMPACIWHPDLEAQFVLKLREKLDAASLNTKIWMYDHNFGGIERVLWCLHTYPALLQACDGVAWHYYEGGVEMTARLAAEYPQLASHFTEGGPRLYDYYATDWCKWGSIMANALATGCRTFTGWNLLLDESGCPNIGPFFCGGLATLHSQTNELSYSGQYRAFAHFSRFIKPGAEIYPVTIADDVPSMFLYPNTGKPIAAVAAKNPDGSFVLQLVNPNSDKRQVQYERDGRWYYVELLPDSLVTVVQA